MLPSVINQIIISFLNPAEVLHLEGFWSDEDLALFYRTHTLEVGEKTPLFLTRKFKRLKGVELVEHIHERLTHLSFGNNFNQPVILPEGLEQVTFGANFNQPVILPEGLEQVTFGANFNRPVILPKGLKQVTFGTRYNQLITLPKGLKKVMFR
jgi:hypothetical protein